MLYISVIHAWGTDKQLQIIIYFLKYLVNLLNFVAVLFNSKFLIPTQKNEYFVF